MRPLRLVLISLALIYIALTAEALEQDSWRGFYQPSNSTVQRVPNGYSDICLHHIQRAQERHGIPDNLLLAIGIQEAGRQIADKVTVWPWTANADGKGRYFNSKSALENWVQEIQGRGIRSIDVGCMQVNQRWHAQHFASLAEATDPAANVNYAARYLSQLYAETGDWWEAAGRYHSATPDLKAVYLHKLAQNHTIAQTVKMRPDTAPEPTLSRPGFHWTSDMTGSGAARMGNALSIYSRTPIQPILPQFIEAR